MDSDDKRLKSVFKASYFKGFNDPQSIKKSRIAMDVIEEKNIDDNSFKIMPNFIKPNNDFILKKKSGKCYLQQESFFCCYTRRKTYDIRLINSKLSISSNENIVRFVDFNVVWADVDESKNGFIISFEQSSYKIYIEPAKNENENETKEWVKLLRQVIKTTEGKNKQYTFFIKRKQLDFYRTQQVLNQEFQKCANSLDLVLFKSQHSAATVQRIFTDSQYDHVGVVLRNKKNQLFIYQSTSDSGVGFTAWRHFVRYQWYESIDKVVWRPLQIQLSKKDIEIIEAFVVKTLGKQFQITLQKLFKFKSTIQRSDDIQQSKTYFCSELVARLYKQLGILDSNKASTTYYPVDFSEKGFLKIVRSNVVLKNQRLISFDKST